MSATLNSTAPVCVVLDTNIVLDLWLYQDPATLALQEALSQKRVRWLATQVMRDELERTVKEYLPRSWYTYRDMPVLRFTLANGSIIQSISADEPEKLKRGRADVVLFNEAQMMARDALTYGIPATIDRGAGFKVPIDRPRLRTGACRLR